MEFSVTFTADEVNKRIVTKGSPPITEFLKRSKDVDDDKTSYSLLLCQKISALFPQRPAFSISGTLKPSARGKTTTCYALCPHDTSNTVIFTTADLKPNSDLKFTIKMHCHDCVENRSGSSVSTKTSQAIAPVSSMCSATFVVPTDSTASQVLVNAFTPGSVADRYNRAALKLSKVLQNSLASCLSLPEIPAQRLMLINCKDQIEQKLISAWREAMIGFELDEPHEVPPVELNSEVCFFCCASRFCL